MNFLALRLIQHLFPTGSIKNLDTGSYFCHKFGEYSSTKVNSTFIQVGSPDMSWVSVTHLGLNDGAKIWISRNYHSYLLVKSYTKNRNRRKYSEVPKKRVYVIRRLSTTHRLVPKYC